MQEAFEKIHSFFFTKLIGEVTLYSIISTVVKFILVVLVLVFLSRIVKMIFMDIRSVYAETNPKAAYLRLMNDPRAFDFPIRDEYYLSDNTTIGRADDNNIVIKDRLMSKHQARILEKEGYYFIDDLQSTNPTMVNGRIVEAPTELRTHDLVTLGGLDFAFIDEEGEK